MRRTRSGQPGHLTPRRWWRALAFVGSVATVVLLGHSLGAYLPDIRHELRHPQLGWLAAAVAVQLVSMTAFSELHRTVLRAAGTTVGARRMLGLTFEANAVSGSLPAGTAFGAAYRVRRFTEWGASAPAAGFTFVAAGLVSTLTFGVLAVGAAGASGGRSTGSGPAVLAAVVLVVAVFGIRQLSRHPAATRRALVRCSAVVDRVRRRRSDPSASPLSAVFDATSAIRPRVRDWSLALCYSSINWVADLVCLYAASRAVGGGALHLEAVVVAYIAGMSVSGISLAPGALGTVEATMIFAMRNAGGTHAAAIGSVLLYRLVSYALMVTIGWALHLVRRHRGVRAVATGRLAATLRAADASPGSSAAAR